MILIIKQFSHFGHIIAFWDDHSPAKSQETYVATIKFYSALETNTWLETTAVIMLG